MSQLIAMIVRIDDVNKPEELNEVWSQPLPQVSLEGLEAAHTLEAANDLNLHRLILSTSSLFHEESIHGQIRIREIELNLNCRKGQFPGSRQDSEILTCFLISTGSLEVSKVLGSNLTFLLLFSWTSMLRLNLSILA